MIIAPKLDHRTQEDFYQQMLELANVYCKIWADFWSLPNAINPTADVGKVMIILIAMLAEYIAQQINKIPNQRMLAFLEFMNVQMRLPTPAIVPLTFMLDENQSSIGIPKDTYVEQASNHQIIFKTDKDLLVLPINIEVGLFIDPEQDVFFDASAEINSQKQGFYIFGKASDNASLNHYFYLGDSTLFASNGSIKSLKITLSGTNLLPAYFLQWFDGDAKPLRTQVTANTQNTLLTVIFKDLPKANVLTIESVLENTLGVEALAGGINLKQNIVNKLNQQSRTDKVYWINVKPAPGLKILAKYKNNLPKITNINSYISSNASFPDFTLANGISVNIKNGAYPFGTTPAIDDAFYIASNAIFSMQGAEIILEFSVRNINSTVNPATASLIWEFWDGNQWQAFNDTEYHKKDYHFIDKVNNLTANNSNGKTYIKFKCPNIEPTKINNIMNRWIRVRLASGNYGMPLQVQTYDVATVIEKIPDQIVQKDEKSALVNYLNKKAGINFGFQVNNSQYTPPFINALSISYVYSAEPQLLVTHNNFDTQDFIIHPYVPVQDQLPAFYIGFNPKRFTEFVINEELTLFFAIESNPVINSTYKSASREVAWQYHSTKGWKHLSVKDATNGLQAEGIISFSVPTDIQLINLFGRELYWIKIIKQTKETLSSPWVQGLYPNSVSATNKVTFHGEMLGTGTGQPSQQFKFSHAPVLGEQVVEIIETTYNSNKLVANTMPTASLISEKNDAVQLTDITNTITVVWQEVDNFVFSSSTDRHYTLNHQNGVITFGDGVNGMAVPKGINNIIAKTYSTTAGFQGNIPASTLTILQKKFAKTVRVNNFIAASGGTDGDTIKEVIKRSPKQLKTRDRAVNLDDFAWLAMNATPKVLSAKALSHWDGSICVYILPDLPGAKPLPDINLVKHIEHYLQQRAPVLSVNKISVTGPAYRVINVIAQVSIAANMQAHTIINEITQLITNYLHPIRHNSSHKSWDFGDHIYTVNLISLINKVAGIQQVLAISLNGVVSEGLQLAANELPCSGEIIVNVYNMEA